MFDHYMAVEAMIKERQKYFLRNAREYHRLQTLKDVQPNLQSRFVLKIAAFLIAVGNSLQKRYQPVSHYRSVTVCDCR